MMTADEARKELERERDHLKVCQLAFFEDQITRAIKLYEDTITVDLDVFSIGVQHELMCRGFRVSTRDLDNEKTRVQVRWD